MFGLKEKNNITAIIVFLIILVFFISDILILKSIKIGPDVGVFLTNARDWVIYKNVPSIHTFGIYTPFGYAFYAIPYLLFTTPQIEHFYYLNLFLFFITTTIFYSSAKKLITNRTLLLLGLVSFLYNFHGIVYDIKLENVTLFLNILIIYLIFIFRESKNFYYLIAIGVLSALSFLTKQYGGLSLLFSLFLLPHLHFRNLKMHLIVISSFCLIIVSFVLIQVKMSLTFGQSLNQLIGNFYFNCKGVNSGGVNVYGERKIINLFLSFKYYKFNLFLIFLVFSLLVKSLKFDMVNKLLFGLLFLVFTQIPFYFQLFPHYVHFGFPFFLFYLMKLNSDFNSIEGPIKSEYLKYFQNLSLVAALSITLYTGILQLSNLKETQNIKREKYNFYSEINSRIKFGSRVFNLNNRQLWYACNFITPVPKYMGYSWAGITCFTEAVKLEKPVDFWLSDINPINKSVSFKGYLKCDQVEVMDSNFSFYAVYFKKQ
jgi:4-amino-4-deoxy-L-arabinose transferase-like glycosyltransferase